MTAAQVSQEADTATGLQGHRVIHRSAQQAAFSANDCELGEGGAVFAGGVKLQGRPKEALSAKLQVLLAGISNTCRR
jgi:hypothetical protein